MYISKGEDILYISYVLSNPSTMINPCVQDTRRLHSGSRCPLNLDGIIFVILLPFKPELETNVGGPNHNFDGIDRLEVMFFLAPELPPLLLDLFEAMQSDIAEVRLHVAKYICTIWESQISLATEIAQQSSFSLRRNHEL